MRLVTGVMGCVASAWMAWTTDRPCSDIQKARRKPYLFHDAPNAKGGRNAYAQVWTETQTMKLKLPSTVAIKHEILKMMVQDELKAQALAVKAVEVLVAHGRGAAEALIAHIRHDGNNIGLIPSPIDQNPCAHWRNPMDMMRQGWSTSLFQASQQWSTRSSKDLKTRFE